MNCKKNLFKTDNFFSNGRYIDYLSLTHATNKKRNRILTGHSRGYTQQEKKKKRKKLKNIQNKHRASNNKE